MNGVLVVYKPQGVTPFQLIETLKKEDPEYENQKIGFAGRLDPLAHGVMVLLVGEENKNRIKYLDLNKEYEFRVLFGVKTDSFDYLGLLQSEFKAPSKDLKKQISKFINEYTGELTLKYPPFSSKTVNGTPLYKLAKKHQLGQVNLPERQIKIEQFELLGIETKSSVQIQEEILLNLRKIKGFFRQTRIIHRWNEFFKQKKGPDFVLAKFRIKCSSGTYVRTLASLMGDKTGCGAIAYEILRTKVGYFKLPDSIVYTPAGAKYF